MLDVRNRGCVLRTRRLALVLALLVLAVLAPTAAAVTPQEARAVAKRVIAAGPEAAPFDPSGPLIAAERKRWPVVEIHRLRRTVKRGALVGQGVERARRGHRVRQRSFIFWGDYAPGAGFVHPSRIGVLGEDVMIYIAAHGWAPQSSTVKLPDGQGVAKSDEARVTIKSKPPVARSSTRTSISPKSRRSSTTGRT